MLSKPAGRSNALYAIAVMFCLMTVPALAQDAPLPQRKTQALGALKEKLQSEQDQEKDLKKKMASAEADREQSRKGLIKLGKDLQSSEQKLSSLEKRTVELGAEEAVIKARLEKDFGSISNLILALQRMRRLPPETIVIRPGAPLQAAQSAMLLKSMLPAINSRAKELKFSLERLQTVQQDLAADRARALEISEKLKAEQAEMQKLLDNREKLYRQTRTDYEIQAESVARISAEAQSLQQLLSRIEREEERTQNENHRATRASVKLPSLPGGAWQQPVSGTVTIRFGETDDIGAESSGIRISTRSGALVTAPAGGVVRFAGPFRHYGNMVIIEHAGDYHSLIGGLSRIDLSVGRNISAGEPIGTMSGSGNASPPKLYYELRHNGKPVDPAAKFPSLS